MDYFRIDQVCDVNPPKDISRFKGMEISFIPMDAVSTTGEVDISRTISGDGVKNYSVFQNRDVLFAKITPCMENGKGGIVDELKNGFGAGSTEFIVIRPDEKKVIPEWLQLFLSQSSYRLECKNHMTGSAGQKRVPPKFIAGTKIPVPSVDEQRRIVSRIEELFSELDNSVSTLQKTKEQLAVYRQAVLKVAFEGKLTEKWREEHPSISISEYWNMICEYKQNTGNTKPYHEDENIELCSLPKEWKWIHVGDISSGPEYGTSQKSAKEGLVPVLRMGNLQNGQIDWEDLVYTSDPVEIEKYYLQPNTILFNRTNSAEHVGKTAIYRGQREAIFAGYLIRINQYDCVDPDYLNYYMNSFVAKSYGKMVKTDGVNQSNINGKKLCSYPLPICTLEEQKELVSIIESRLSVCDSIEQTVDTALQQAEAMRQSILKQAFKGRL